MSLTFNGRNTYGCGCGEREDTGTTYRGRQIIYEMNRFGALVDLSHLGHRTAMEVTQISSKPVVLTHSNCYALTPSPRNVPDDLIRAVADTGGIIGLSVYAPMCDPGTGENPTLDDFLNHVDHAVNLVGIDHVGLGTDANVRASQDGGRNPLWWRFQQQHRELVPAYHQEPRALGNLRYHRVDGFPDISALPAVTQGLLDRGYSEEDIIKFLGGNILRVLDTVW